MKEIINMIRHATIRNREHNFEVRFYFKGKWRYWWPVNPFFYVGRWFRHIFEELGIKKYKYPKGEPYYSGWKSRFRSLLRPDLWRSESFHLRFNLKEFLTGYGKSMGWLIFLDTATGTIDCEATGRSYEEAMKT